MPAAVVGSIALVLSSAPAEAFDAAEERMPRPALADGRHVFAARTGPSVPLVRALPAMNAAPATYTVKRGDTVSAIAARHGLRTADVLAINGLTWRSVIYPGQVLRLSAARAAAPAPATPSAATGTYTVKGGDTVSAIAQRHGISVQAVLSANRLGWSSIIYPGQKLRIPGRAVPAAATKPAAPAPAPATTSYVVRAGDTVTAIAQRHGVGVNAVLTANKLSAASIIYPGQKLAIPAKASAAVSAPAAATGLDAPQTENARLIIRIGRELGVPDRGIAIALGTAMQESWIRNLDWGDRDSLGLFQQRPSTGWGTADQVRDRVRSIKAFYGGPGDPNGTRTRGLLDIPDWQSMSFAQAAQAVQVSAYPDRYARWEKPAYAWLAALG
ncbi:LysM peptidoglycan-binding domain-containing protein [Microbacterium sp. SSM24]|uniref:LysM peptidoglycan-binding domain-containing protein n=1 Tax=Microbacterium sp. SSM24 TaxID=2991714 RepID=UPI002225C50A|nr:LysM peptidoglycan-binding domain-containing protein [Microbacterium sp. SSM24]MCW3494761.1 LysM peptidoglycan-binding domain-containing protein [Microbacterium sp. SSM24]